MTHSVVDYLIICTIIQQWYWYQNGLTALHGAAQGGHLEVVRLLLYRGANIEATYDVS